MPLIPGRVSDERLAEFAADARHAQLSYEPIGATRTQPSARGRYRLDHHHIDLPASPDTFDRACMTLRQWGAHTGAGARVAPRHASLEVGQTVVVALALPGITAVAPCRIVWADDEADRFGFAYGTLDGHPERGEESFLITRGEAGVRFEIVAYSRPAAALARLAGPIARRIQTSVTHRYLHALGDAVASR